MTSDTHMSLKTSHYLLHKLSWRTMSSCYTGGSGSGHKITYYQYFTHIAYKGEDRKGEMKNYLGEKLLNDLQFYWKIFHVAL